MAVMSERGDPISGSVRKYKWIKLSPGSSFRFSSKLSFDQKCSLKPARYLAKAEYWGAIREPDGNIREVTIESNEVEFKVKTCSAKAEHEN